MREFFLGDPDHIVSRTELSRSVRQLIQAAIPSTDALEAFIVLVRNRERAWTPAGVVATILPAVIAESAVAEYLEGFLSEGLAVEREPGAFAYRPASPAIETAVAELLSAYNERPVTLIRTVYEIAQTRNIQSFADAFRIKKDT